MTTERVYLQEGSHTLEGGQLTGIITTIEEAQVQIDIDISPSGQRFRAGGVEEWTLLPVESYRLIAARSATGRVWLVAMIGLFDQVLQLVIVPPMLNDPTAAIATPPVA